MIAEQLSDPTLPVKSRLNRRWISLFGLSTAAFVDNGEDQALSILWPRMYPALGLSVGQLGFILGISKLVMTLTLPFWGYAADRFSRKTLLVVFTGMWGLWTLAIGLVDSLPQLLLVRVMSALGLGVFGPAAFSLIGDLYDNSERGRATGITSAASIIGSIAAFGVLPALADRGPEAWRTGFVVMGLASFVSGLLMIFIQEPARGASEPELRSLISKKSSSRYAFTRSELRVLLRIRSWRLLLFNETLVAMGIGVFSGWAFTWLDGLGLGSSAFIIVLLMALGSIGGAFAFGWLGDWLDQRFAPYGRIAQILIALILILPILILFLTIGEKSLVLLTVLGFLYGAGTTAAGTSVTWPVAQAILPPEVRGSGRAVINMTTGAATALVLAVSGWFANQFGVTTMLLVVTPLPVLLSIVIWIPVFRTYPRDREALHRLLNQRRSELLGETER